MENEEKKKEQEHSVKNSINEMFGESPAVRALRAASNTVSSSPGELVEKNIDTLLPRLKHGHVEGASPGKVKMTIEAVEKEFDLPVSAQLYGFDLGPDFTCCFAVDHGNGYQLLTNAHVAHLRYSKQQLLVKACQNFLREYGAKIQFQQTVFPGINMIRIDGNTEATTFMLTNLWQQIKEQSKMDKLFVFIPIQDLVFYWGDDVTEEIYQNLISKMHEAIKNNPESRRISDYVFEFTENKFVNAGKAIDMK